MPLLPHWDYSSRLLVLVSPDDQSVQRAFQYAPGLGSHNRRRASWRTGRSSSLRYNLIRSSITVYSVFFLKITRHLSSLGRALNSLVGHVKCDWCSRSASIVPVEWSLIDGPVIKWDTLVGQKRRLVIHDRCCIADEILSVWFKYPLCYTEYDLCFKW